MPKRSPAAGHPASPSSSQRGTNPPKHPEPPAALKRLIRGGAAAASAAANRNTAPGSVTIDPSTAVKIAPPKPAKPNKLEMLLAVEAMFRKAQSVEELRFLLINETRNLVDFAQGLVFQMKQDGALQLETVSSVSVVERNAPYVRWMEGVMAHAKRQHDLTNIMRFDLTDFPVAQAVLEEAVACTFKKALWVPLTDRRGKVFAGVLFLSAQPWTDQQEQIPARLAETASHSWAALNGGGKLEKRTVPRKWLWVAAILLTLAMFIPVPMTVLAPAEVIARDPVRIASPIDGVVDKILVEPNQMVAKGDELFRYVDTELRSEFENAEKSLSIAQARLRRATQAAFSDPKMKAEVSIAQSEVALARAERDYTARRLQYVSQKAPSNGLAIYADKDEWTGKPVTTGERILNIADPKKVRVRLDVPVADAIALNEGSAVRIFLDSDPLRPLSGTIEHAAYHAEPTPAQVLAYRVQVLLDREDVTPRIGLQGTAQIYGETVFLGFFLFRRPLSAARQYLGI